MTSIAWRSGLAQLISRTLFGEVALLLNEQVRAYTRCPEMVACLLQRSKSSTSFSSETKG